MRRRWLRRSAHSPMRESPTSSSCWTRSPSTASPHSSRPSPRSTADTIGHMEPAPDTALPTMRIGRSGRLEATALEVAGDHAVLVGETGGAGRRRALLTTDKLPTGERLVVMPLDEDVEVRVDGDALAVWLGSGILGDVPRQLQSVAHTDVP